ncbi:MAG TPA: rRNA maturation RNase YbeY [Aestuariivirga sp.]|nr:rRNA maturation RNase YbeY [Aestuariivirga sp.]
MIVSIAVEDSGWDQIPALEQLTRRAVDATTASAGVPHKKLEAAFLFTDDEAMAFLNAKWRGRAGATNVLSFPAKQGPSPKSETRPLGDIVLASGVVTREALDQDKTLPHHTSHLIVHGLLHLLGYDHETGKEAAEMERLEARILKELGISDPYD